MAKSLQKQGIASISIDFRGYGNSKTGRSSELYYDVLGAVDYLEKRGYEHIALVGGSMGGEAVLCALGHRVNPRIDKVVLLAPAGGEVIRSQTIKKLFKIKKAKILVNSRRCQKELKLAGIKADLVYTPIYNIKQYKPSAFPDKFTVAIYCSDSNRMHKLDSQDGFSNVPLLMEVAKSLPMIDFKFFGLDKVTEKKDNIEFCGKIPEEEMPSFIGECSMIVRSTVHDGFPQLPIQFLLSGRFALTSCPDKELKFADKLSFEDNLDWEKNKSEVINKILEMRNRRPKPFRLSESAHEYYGDLMNVDKYKEEIYKYV